MKPVAELHRLSPGLVVWCDFDPAVRCDCSSACALSPAGWILFDPLPLAPGPWEELLAAAPVHAIALTSGNHQRDSLQLRERFGAPIHAPEEARGSVEADVWHLPGGGIEGFRLIALPGGGPGESAWYDGTTLVLGDALTNLGEPAILPNKYCADPNLLRKSLASLLNLPLNHAVLAHGFPIPGHRFPEVLRQVASLES